MATATFTFPDGETFEQVLESIREIGKRQEETSKQMQETDKRMEETSRKMGLLNNSFGELVEHLVAPGIADKFNELGHHFDGIAKGGYEITDSKGMTIAEVDILLENGDCLLAVEVKSKPKSKDIEHHIKRLEILREHRNKKNDYRKIFGAVAGAVFSDLVKLEAIDAGFYVLEQSGDTMNMDIPDGFAPREY